MANIRGKVSNTKSEKWTMKTDDKCIRIYAMVGDRNQDRTN